MGQLTVRPVNLAPLVEQRHDLGGLVGQDPVGWVAARRVVVELVTLTTGQPPPRPTLPEVQFAAGPAQRPTRGNGMVDQLEQPCLGGRVDAQRDPAT